MTAAKARRRRSVAYVATGLVAAGVIGFLVHSFTSTRDSDLARIDAKFARINCDSLRREVASRKSAVESGSLFALYFPNERVRVYYTRGLPRRVANRDEAIAEFARLKCPPKSAAPS